MYQSQNKFKNRKKNNGSADIKLKRNKVSHPAYYDMSNGAEESDISNEEVNEGETSKSQIPSIPSIPSLPKVSKLRADLGKTTKKIIKGLDAIPFFKKYKLIILLALAITLIFGLLVLTALGMFEEGSGGSSSTFGYYDPSCNFNEAKVNYTNGTTTYSGLTLEEFVIGSTYSYIKDSSYYDEGIKAIMVIVKTNALSYGNYSNSSKLLTVSDSYVQYVSTGQISSSVLNRLKSLYSLVSDEIYVATTYSGTISSLSSANALLLDETTFTNLVSMQQAKNYGEILTSLYNSNGVSRKLYKISDNCTYFTLTSNDSYWWPIGSASPTSGNIYGGKPTSTTITSYFGPRVVEGTSGNHGAIDIGASCQSNVVIATKAGVVETVSNGCDNNGYYGNPCGGRLGNYVIINHGGGIVSIYAHLFPNSIIVTPGQSVEQGEKLALVGNSGSSTGCHLHFEIRINGNRVDPLNYVSVDNPRAVSQYSLLVVDDNVLNPKETKAAVCKSLLASGFSKNAVAGMMVNIEREGSFKLNNLEGCYETGHCCPEIRPNYGFCNKGWNPDIYANDTSYTNAINFGILSRDAFINDQAGYGLIQWTSSDRKAGLYDYAKAKNKSIATLSVQLGYLFEEIKQPSYATTYKYVTGNYSAYDIANNFCLNFESPNEEEIVCPDRARTYSDIMLSYVENDCS